MFNFKTSGIIAGAAFILSLLIAFASGSRMPMLILKPLLFAVLFFVIPGLVRMLAEHFLPELTEEGGYSGGESEFLPGSRVNIMEGDAEEVAQTLNVPAFMAARQDDSEETLGNISDLMKGVSLSRAAVGENPAGMDQNTENGYTKAGELGELPAADDTSPRRTPAPSSAYPFETGDLLPDLDSMAGVFASGSSPREAAPETTEYSVSAPRKRPSQNSKAQAWAGDFNAKDIAAGLRTVLSKDKEG